MIHLQRCSRWRQRVRDGRYTFFAVNAGDQACHGHQPDVHVVIAESLVPEQQYLRTPR